MDKGMVSIMLQLIFESFPWFNASVCLQMWCLSSRWKGVPTFVMSCSHINTCRYAYKIFISTVHIVIFKGCVSFIHPQKESEYNPCMKWGFSADMEARYYFLKGGIHHDTGCVIWREEEDEHTSTEDEIHTPWTKQLFLLHEKEILCFYNYSIIKFMPGVFSLHFLSGS